METSTQVDRYARNPLVYLCICIVAYLFIGYQYAALTPRWQVPDEPAHYNFIRELVEKQALPVLDPGEYQQAYLEELKSQGFPPELSIETINYESWQPPLYYLLAAPVYAASNGDLLTLRLFSLLIGAGVIIFAYLTVREAMPDKPWVAVVAAGFIAFIPQHIAMLAGINNDSLSELVIAIGLWLIIKGNKGTLGNKGTWALGVVIAAALVTKSQAYVLVPVAGLMLLFRWWRERSHNSLISNLQFSSLKPLITNLVIIFLPALLIGLLWWGRNIATYGWPDFMAAIRHDQVVSDQPRTRQWIAEYGTTEVLRRFFQTTFQSFWGQFGWMGVVMPDRYYLGLLAYSVFLVIGNWLLVISNWKLRTNLKASISNPLITNYYLLITSFLLTLGLYLYYNLTYVQHQGRYLFPALVPIGLAASLSLWGWGRLLETVTKRKIGWLVPVGALAAMAALSLFALYRFILPALT